MAGLSLLKRERSVLTLLAERTGPRSDLGENAETHRTKLVVPCCGGRVWDAGNFLLVAFWDVWGPNFRWRIYWDYVMLSTMVYVVLATPYIIAFDVATYLAHPPSAIAVIDFSVSCVFMTDILIAFRAAVPDRNGVIIWNRRDIALHYLAGWFVPDLISSLPYSIMFGVKELAALKVLRILRILRLVRMMQFVKLMQRLSRYNVNSFFQVLENFFGRTNLRMITLLMLALTLLHWSACAFYFTAYCYDFSEDTWVYQKGLVPTDYDTLGSTDSGANYITRYIYAFYYSTVTMSTVGYGDITAYNIGEMIVACCIIIIGVAMFAYVMGNIAALVSERDSASSNMSRKRGQVDLFLKGRSIPKDLADKVRGFYNYTVAREVQSDEAEIISGLSTNLRMQVIMHLYSDVLERVAIFQGRPPEFISAIVTHLKLEYFSPGDVVLTQGEIGHEMYFVGEGSLEVRVYKTSELFNFDGWSDDQSTNAATEFACALDKGKAPKLGTWLGSKGRHRAAKLRRRAFVQQLLRRPCDGSEKCPYTVVGELTQGDVFGSYSCMLNEPRAATVVASAFAELYRLSRADVEAVVSEFPEHVKDIHELVTWETAVDDAVWAVRETLGLPSRAQLSGLATQAVPAPAPAQAAPQAAPAPAPAQAAPAPQRSASWSRSFSASALSPGQVSSCGMMPQQPAAGRVSVGGGVWGASGGGGGVVADGGSARSGGLGAMLRSSSGLGGGTGSASLAAVRATLSASGVRQLAAPSASRLSGGGSRSYSGQSLPHVDEGSATFALGGRTERAGPGGRISSAASLPLDASPPLAALPLLPLPPLLAASPPLTSPSSPLAASPEVPEGLDDRGPDAHRHQQEQPQQQQQPLQQLRHHSSSLPRPPDQQDAAGG
ncbi:hypothetical protein FOA52_015819 [Chlamydomonas sp. UWO 241]|nr:hypothetical protein FOA52_015819 [Chlamydomonas sp. UWO 241]